MAGGAFAFVGACAELTAVRVGRVAVGAVRKGKRLIEVSASVTADAIHLRMPAEEREFCFRVVEAVVAGNLSPAAGGVTGHASLGEPAVVWIAVAIRTFREWNSPESRLILRPRRSVTLGAGHRAVQARQRISSLRMVELRGGFPIGEIVALGAIGPELTLVDIHVTRHAAGREPEKSPAQILDADQAVSGLADVLRLVALIALESGVLTLQRIAGLVVIERLERRQPMDERKILAVMLGMAFGAISLVDQAGVEAASLGDPLRNLNVAFLALQNGAAETDLVTTRALRRPAERFMRLGKRPRRDLRARRKSSRENEYSDANENPRADAPDFSGNVAPPRRE